MTNPPDKADSRHGREGHPAVSRGSPPPAAPPGQPVRNDPQDSPDRTAPSERPLPTDPQDSPDRTAPSERPLPTDPQDSPDRTAPSGRPLPTDPQDSPHQAPRPAQRHQAEPADSPDQAARQALPCQAESGGSLGQAAHLAQPPQADPRDSPDRAPPRAQAHRTSCASPEAASGWLLARGRRSRHTCPRAGRDSPIQCTGLSHEASRWKPRAIRPQKPGLVVLGMAVTTWLTVATGASAMTVYTNPSEDQAKLRSSGLIE